MQRSHINDRDVENSIIMHRKQSAVGYAANNQPKYCPVSPEWMRHYTESHYLNPAAATVSHSGVLIWRRLQLGGSSHLCLDLVPERRQRRYEHQPPCKADQLGWLRPKIVYFDHRVKDLICVVWLDTGASQPARDFLVLWERGRDDGRVMVILLFYWFSLCCRSQVIGPSWDVFIHRNRK